MWGRLWRRPQPDPIDALITAPVQKFIGHDESLQVKAMKRREIADSIRKRSALVASGSKAGTLLKMARKRA